MYPVIPLNIIKRLEKTLFEHKAQNMHTEHGFRSKGSWAAFFFNANDWSPLWPPDSLAVQLVKRPVKGWTKPWKRMAFSGLNEDL